MQWYAMNFASRQREAKPDSAAMTGVHAVKVAVIESGER